MLDTWFLITAWFKFWSNLKGLVLWLLLSLTHRTIETISLLILAVIFRLELKTIMLKFCLDISPNPENKIWDSDFSFCIADCFSGLGKNAAPQGAQLFSDSFYMRFNFKGYCIFWTLVLTSSVLLFSWFSEPFGHLKKWCKWRLPWLHWFGLPESYFRWCWCYWLSCSNIKRRDTILLRLYKSLW